MSVEAAVQFMQKATTNEALLAQLTKASEGKDDKAALAAVVAAGKANGLDFTAEEAVQARNGVIVFLTKEASKEAGQEMTDAELDQVSGGQFNQWGSSQFWVNNGQGLKNGLALMGTSQGWSNFGSGMATLGQKSTYNNIGNQIKSVFKGW
jgi:hypothetical protein